MMARMPKGPDQEDTDANNMTKRHIAIDDVKLEAVRKELRTTTITETVDAALHEVLLLIERRRVIIENRNIDWGALSDEEHQKLL